MKVKNVLRQTGINKDAALVSLGWIAFLAGAVVPDPIGMTILTAIARVLPKALY
jgi:hypothetical protein